MEIVVFTNGCFDILHPGHIELLKKARRLGTKLIVGLNSDRSVRAIKGSPRPFLNENARAVLLRELRSVDEVLIFDENTPERLIKEIKPDVIVKGGDWTPDQIVGADFVLKNGGKVFSIPFESDFSSSKIVEKIQISEAGLNSELAKSNEQAEFVKDLIEEYIEVFQNLKNQEISNVYRCAELIRQVLAEKRKILICAENNENILFVRAFLDFFNLNLEFKKSIIFPNISIENFNSNVSDQNSIKICEQIKTEIHAGDLIIVINTKENSQKLVSAVMQARQMDCKTIILTIAGEKKLNALSDANVVIDSKNTAQIVGAVTSIFDVWSELIKSGIKELK